MTIPCHLLISWHLARHVTTDVKMRRWIAFAGVFPDLDGVGLLIDAVTRRTNYFEAWHHFGGHNVFAGVFFAGVAWIITRRIAPAAWALVCFHVHLLSDVISGRGPDGSSWPMVYLWPLSDREWEWSGQWRLDAWPNSALFIVLAIWMVAAAYRSGRSPVELVAPASVDRMVIEAFRSVFASRRTRSDRAQA